MAAVEVTTDDVRIWATENRIGKKVNTYTVVWLVAGKRFKEPFRATAAAESFRSELITAQRRGEAFDTVSGRPISKLRCNKPTTSWCEFACAYVDMKWPEISGGYRKGVAEALVSVTSVMLTVSVDQDEAKAIRSALQDWGFNFRQRGSADQPDDVTKRLTWVGDHCRPIADLSRPDALRAALTACGSKLDGTRPAGRTAQRKLAVLSNACNYAVEKDLLPINPIGSIKWSAPKSTEVVDRRSVVNPAQARALLDTVRVTPRTGRRLVGFFVCLYYAALRPEEAVDVRQRNLDLPEVGWGWITLELAAPSTGKTWSDSGRVRDSRQLKHRAVGETRRVPCPPELTKILHWHLKQFGTDADGRLFRGTRGGELATVTYSRMWQRARRAALTKEQYASPLGRRVYDLRHAAVSTWLNGGVAPTQVGLVARP